MILFMKNGKIGVDNPNPFLFAFDGPPTIGSAGFPV